MRVTLSNPHINLEKKIIGPMIYTRKLELNLINLPNAHTLLLDYKSVKTLWGVIQQNLSKRLRSKIIASAIPFVAIYFSGILSQVYEDIMCNCFPCSIICNINYYIILTDYMIQII